MVSSGHGSTVCETWLSLCRLADGRVQHSYFELHSFCWRLQKLVMSENSRSASPTCRREKRKKKKHHSRRHFSSLRWSERVVLSTPQRHSRSRPPTCERTVVSPSPPRRLFLLSCQPTCHLRLTRLLLSLLSVLTLGYATLS